MDSKLTLRSAAGRGTLTAAVLASGMAFLDSTVVNVALPTLGRELDAELEQLQWVVNGYTLTLAGKSANASGPSWSSVRKSFQRAYGKSS